MRTTVAIDDELLSAAKRRAHEQGTTLGRVVETALRRWLSSPTDARPAPTIPIFFAGTGAPPGLDLSSNRTLYEALDDGQPLDRLR